MIWYLHLYINSLIWPYYKRLIIDMGTKNCDNSSIIVSRVATVVELEYIDWISHTWISFVDSFLKYQFVFHLIWKWSGGGDILFRKDAHYMFHTVHVYIKFGENCMGYHSNKTFRVFNLPVFESLQISIV